MRIVIIEKSNIKRKKRKAQIISKISTSTLIPLNKSTFPNRNNKNKWTKK